MTFSQRAVEAAAKALRERDMSGRITMPWDKVTKYQRKKWMERGEAALTAAIAVDGVALVPKEPTSAMIEAGCEHNPTQWNEGTDLGFAADVANDVYRAMLTAASEREERK